MTITEFIKACESAMIWFNHGDKAIISVGLLRPVIWRDKKTFQKLARKYGATRAQAASLAENMVAKIAQEARNQTRLGRNQGRESFVNKW